TNREAVGDGPAEERSGQQAKHQDATRQRPGRARSQAKAPAQVSGDPERRTPQHEEERGLRGDGGAQRGDLEKSEKRLPGDRWTLGCLWTSRFGCAAQWLAEPECQDREDQARHGGQVKGGPPAERAGTD